MLSLRRHTFSLMPAYFHFRHAISLPLFSLYADFMPRFCFSPDYAFALPLLPPFISAPSAGAAADAVSPHYCRRHMRGCMPML